MPEAISWRLTGRIFSNSMSGKSILCKTMSRVRPTACHFQKGEFSQAKLVRVIEGRVLDVAVDLRKSSPTFGKYVAVELSDENARQLFIPRGFAHGFLVLSPTATFVYKVDNVYAPQSEASLIYNDPQVGIEWPIAEEEMLLSPKDRAGKPLSEVYCFD